MSGPIATCSQCGSALRANAPFCGSCGQVVSRRERHVAATPVAVAAPAPVAAPYVQRAGRDVRCASFLLDLAAMLSPALPLAIAAALLNVAEIVYVVVPIAFVAIWVWMQLWQGYTGMSFGKSMLGLRLVNAADHSAPGIAATVTRGGVFAATLGFAAVPVISSATPADGMHDRVAGVMVVDVVRGANPFGPRPSAILRRATGNGHGLNKVHSPLPVNSSGRR